MMKHQNPLQATSLQAAAAAVMMALGSAAIAQQGAEQQDPSERLESAQRAGEQAGERAGDAAERAGESAERAAQQAGESVERAAESAQQQGAGAADQQQERTDVAAAGGAGQGSADLDRLAEEHQDLSTFFDAVEAAGMGDALTDGTSYTLFVPTDDAFEQSGADLEQLMQPENRDQLVSLLRAHIVADDVDSEMARSLQQAQTIDGGTINISESDGELMVGDATVEQPDIQQGSIRIHAIDQVLSGNLTRSAEAEGEQGQEESLRR